MQALKAAVISKKKGKATRSKGGEKVGGWVVRVSVPPACICLAEEDTGTIPNITPITYEQAGPNKGGGAAAAGAGAGAGAAVSEQVRFVVRACPNVLLVRDV